MNEREREIEELYKKVNGDRPRRKRRGETSAPEEVDVASALEELLTYLSAGVHCIRYAARRSNPDAASILNVEITNKAGYSLERGVVQNKVAVRLMTYSPADEVQLTLHGKIAEKFIMACKSREKLTGFYRVERPHTVGEDPVGRDPQRSDEGCPDTTRSVRDPSLHGCGHSDEEGPVTAFDSGDEV